MSGKCAILIEQIAPLNAKYRIFANFSEISSQKLKGLRAQTAPRPTALSPLLPPPPSPARVRNRRPHFIGGSGSACGEAKMDWTMTSRRPPGILSCEVIITLVMCMCVCFNIDCLTEKSDCYAKNSHFVPGFCDLIHLFARSTLIEAFLT